MPAAAMSILFQLSEFYPTCNAMLADLHTIEMISAPCAPFDLSTNKTDNSSIISQGFAATNYQ
jgi:hypothetical protein